MPDPLIEELLIKQYEAAIPNDIAALRGARYVHLRDRVKAKAWPKPWPNYQLGHEQCSQLLNRGVDIDAILAYSDAIAVGGLRALRDRTALTVPDDVSMVGFDGLTIGKYMVPRLTSIGIPGIGVALAAQEARLYDPSLIDAQAFTLGQASSRLR
jgi:DNA-binding LacI/PurR family transcriptional regulator